MDWTPPKFLFEAQHRRREKLYMAPSNWDTSFRTFRSYSDTVLEYLRRKGYNATFIIRICTGLLPSVFNQSIILLQVFWGSACGFAFVSSDRQFLGICENNMNGI